MNTDVAAAYAEYEQAFLAPPVERVYYDWNLRCYMRCVVQELSGPRHAPPPRHEDAALEHEPFESEQDGFAAARRARQAATAVRRTTLRDMIVDDLRTNGPAATRALMHRIGLNSINRVLDVLRAHPDVFIRHNGRPLMWALPGQTVGKIAPVNRTGSRERVQQLHALLQEHGPLTATDLAKLAKSDAQNVTKRMERNPELFEVVGERDVRVDRRVQVWGAI
jgi:hypothetical protein